MIEFLLAAALTLRDPPGDAVGEGSLVPPTAEHYRALGSFDLLEVRVLDAPTLTLEIEMGALPNPGGLANGFSNAVIDVYLDTADGGTEELLPGSEMRMPQGRGWELALRVTGDGATAYRSDGAADGDTPTIAYPVRVATADRVIRIDTPFERGDVRSAHALTGVYDPFLPSGWRPVSGTVSPWAFSGDQRRPVIDLLAPDSGTQADAIRAGELPLLRQRAQGAMWVLLMVLGVAVAGVGLVLRRLTPSTAAPTADPSDGRVVRGAPGAASAAEGGAVPLPRFLPALPPPAQAGSATSPRGDDVARRDAEHATDRESSMAGPAGDADARADDAPERESSVAGPVGDAGGADDAPERESSVAGPVGDAGGADDAPERDDGAGDDLAHDDPLGSTEDADAFSGFDLDLDFEVERVDDDASLGPWAVPRVPLGFEDLTLDTGADGTAASASDGKAPSASDGERTSASDGTASLASDDEEATRRVGPDDEAAGEPHDAGAGTPGEASDGKRMKEGAAENEPVPPTGAGTEPRVEVDAEGSTDSTGDGVAEPAPDPSDRPEPEAERHP